LTVQGSGFGDGHAGEVDVLAHEPRGECLGPPHVRVLDSQRLAVFLPQVFGAGVVLQEPVPQPLFLGVHESVLQVLA
jgi:hypothetical protein